MKELSIIKTRLFEMGLHYRLTAKTVGKYVVVTVLGPDGNLPTAWPELQATARANGFGLEMEAHCEGQG